MYLIKSLKWTKHNGYDTWYAPNSNGYVNRICNAGIYTEEDKNSIWAVDDTGRGIIEYIPITDELVETAIKQVTVEIEKLEEWLKKEKNNLAKANELRHYIRR